MDIEVILIFVNLFIFIVAPFLPDVFYNYFVDTYVGAFIFLCLSLYSISYGYLVTVSTFSSVGAFYAESHARKAKSIKTVAPSVNVAPAPLEKLVPNEVHPEIEAPHDETLEVVPTKENDDTFKAVDVSINEKEALPSVSFSKDAEEIYLQENLAEGSILN